jgi:hypothetical protein
MRAFQTKENKLNFPTLPKRAKLCSEYPCLGVCASCGINVISQSGYRSIELYNAKSVPYLVCTSCHVREQRSYTQFQIKESFKNENKI